MNASNATGASNTEAIINPLFCIPSAIDLAFTTKPREHESGHLATIDSAGNIVFKAKGSSGGGLSQLVDSVGRVLVTMKAKFQTLHDRWQAFAGDSIEPKYLLFSIKRSSTLQLHDEWFVYLAANTKEEVCDFRITGSYCKKSYTIYRGDSSFVVARMTKKHKLNLSLKKHAFGASINANCDHSFVAALIAVFHLVYGNDPIMKAAIIGTSIGESISKKSKRLLAGMVVAFKLRADCLIVGNLFVAIRLIL